MIKITMKYDINNNRTTVKIRKNTIKKEEVNKLALYPGFSRVEEEKGNVNYIFIYEGTIKECEEKLKIMFDKKQR